MEVMITGNKLVTGRHNTGLAPLRKLDGKRGLSDVGLLRNVEIDRGTQNRICILYKGHLALVVA